ncbi:hypothetical protein LEMA_P124060.1 [Plenodomus lingam JN3]|uniref:NADH:quinone oxidoreductase/Mrp antiporter membrane subunit domain-containing protein n=1 Tax=Leptosphaeria maculans (strain JN3 / isolate v23.1.3 / race Av1-4-5-6-7-8) TaxID=985895 RepID=E4ZQ78_LEPMJ|nr:hypothetical protein LEMA_P124060.1 [Plenodomus lingam JN3]CBX89988.1 hypothetical protein LEMA_P124060.1 [Plenodomus lingam JN3]
MQKIVEYLGSGNIYKYAGKSAVSLSIVDFKDITNIIIPFLNKNTIIGIKLINLIFMHIQRFFSYLSLFTFMMLIIPANQSALSAFLTNRVGDCFLTIGMFAIILAFGNLDYATVFSLAPYMNENLVTIVGVCLVIGAMAKSSQVGLHV